MPSLHHPGALLLGFGFLVAQTLLPPLARAQPEWVLLMRHGHKSDLSDTYNLSSDGLQRALALAALVPPCFGPPTDIRTFYLDPLSSKNARSYQTAVPLAVATGVNIVMEQASREDSRQAGRDILTGATFKGARVVLFWEHRHLPALAAGLGWPSMPPIADGDFDQLIELRYPAGSLRPVVRRFSQEKLLRGQQRCDAP